jgi:hypothetical protein
MKKLIITTIILICLSLFAIKFYIKMAEQKGT